MYNIYFDYFKLPFKRILWSKLVNLHVDKTTGRYLCDCCNKHPMQCENNESAYEYSKINAIIKRTDSFSHNNVDIPIYETGYIRADLHSEARLVWKIQRVLAERGGIILHKSPFL